MLIENYLLSYKQFKFLLDEKKQLNLFIHSIYILFHLTQTSCL